MLNYYLYSLRKNQIEMENDAPVNLFEISSTYFIPELQFSLFKLEGSKYIIEKYSSKENRFFIQFSFEHVKHNFFTPELKFEYLKRILESSFVSESQKENFFAVFSILQKCFSAFSRLIYLAKYKKSKIYNTCDLYGDPIQGKPRNTALILQNNTRYFFTIRELINTINTSLSNSPYFFSEPVSCKNPYTNVPFDKSTLYNIYFAIKSSTYLMPILFHQYFLTNFDLYDFSLKNEMLVREKYIHSYVSNMCSNHEETIREKVLSMFETHHITELKINPNFPEERLLEIMRPYLNLYYKSKYDLQPPVRKYYNTILKFKLYEFIKYNPIFGRKYIAHKKNETNHISGKEVKYNDAHIPFSLKTSPFVSSHLTIDSSFINEYQIQNHFNGYHPDIAFNSPNTMSSRTTRVVREEESEEEESEEESEEYKDTDSDSDETIILSNDEEEDVEEDEDEDESEEDEE